MDYKTLEIFLNNLLSEYQGNVPGAAIGIILKNKLILTKGFGLANINKKEKCSSRTNFRLASVTKQFTAICILQLMEKGLLNVKDPLCTYFPQFHDAKKVTIYHLLTHTSGFLEYEELIKKNRKNPINDREVLNLLAKQKKIKFKPGTSYSYNNGGYCILKELIEQVSKTSYQKYLEENIFKPLQMKDSILSQRNKTNITNRAFGYTIMNNKIIQTDNDLTSFTMGDGSIYSSVEDLAKWCINKNKIISKSLLNLAQKPHIQTNQKGEYYGFGFEIKKLNRNKVICHEGYSIGFRSSIYLLPHKKIGVIFVSNSNKNEGNEFTEKIAKFLLENNSYETFIK